MKDLFLIDKDIAFLNFGSFGACPKPIFEAYQNYQRALESDPVQFLTVLSPIYIRNSRIALAEYIHCHEDDVVLVSNPSYAVNIIAKSLNLQAGDEVLTTELEYGACDKTWEYYCKKSNAKYIRQKINFPISDKQQIVEQLFKGVSPKTKLIFVSHITSSTAIQLPVKEICQKAQSLGIMTFIDGAHGPGQADVNIQDLQVNIYTGACHKWMMAPKGCSFLYVKNELQKLFDPLLISWGYNSDHPSHSQFLDYHEMQGTRDTSAFCTLSHCLDFMRAHDWEAVSDSCRKLAQENALEFCDILGKKPMTPIHDDFIRQMFSCEINCDSPQKLHDLLYEKYKIQIPVMMHMGKVYMRYSIQAFNSEEDLEKLFGALRELRL